MPAKQQSQWPPVSQFDAAQWELSQHTAEWLASQSNKVRKNERHNAHVEKKRMRLQGDRVRIITKKNMNEKHN